ncbi:MAG: replication protein [Lachnospiraceae bacterium]|nr:replication protein [Lachnospiraceae bacterium]
MANPQTENGYVRIANELCDEIIQYKWNSLSEMKITLFIIRQTYGFNKKSRQLSVTYIANGTKIPADTVKRNLKNLIQKKIVIAKAEYSNSIKTLSINKDYSKWCGVTDDQSSMTSHTQHRCGVTDDTAVVSHVTPNKRQNKDRIKDSSSRQTTTTIPTLEEVKEYCSSKGYTFDCNKFFSRYEIAGWEYKGTQIKNWKALADRWEASEQKEDIKPKEQEPELDMWGKPIKPRWE